MDNNEELLRELIAIAEEQRNWTRDIVGTLEAIHKTLEKIAKNTK